MAVNNIVVGQKVSGDKVARSKELRRDMTTAEAVMWKRTQMAATLYMNTENISVTYIFL